MAEEPKFPKLSGDLDDTTGPSGKKGVFGKALFKTFVQPSLDQLAWKAKQFGPKQMAFNMLSSTPLGQKFLDLKGNYEFLKDPNTEGFHDKKFEGAQPVRNNGEVNTTSAGSSSEIKTIIEVMQSGMNMMTTELKNIRRSIDNLQGTAKVGNTEQVQIKTRVGDLVEFFKKTLNTRLDDKVKTLALEDQSSNNIDSETPKDKAKSWWAMITSAMGNLVSTFRGNMLKGIKKFGTIIADSFKTLGSKFKNIFSKIKLPEIPKFAKFGKIFANLEGLAAKFGRFIEPLSGILKIGGSILKVVGKFSGIVTIIMGVIDGVIGAFRGWNSTDGSVTRKLAGALAGAASGIINGLLEIPKIILQAIKWVGVHLLDMLGFKKLADSIKAFDLAKWWKENINNTITSIAKNMLTGLVDSSEALVNLFLDAVGALVKKFSGIDITDKLKMFRPNRGTERDAAPAEGGGLVGAGRRSLGAEIQTSPIQADNINTGGSILSSLVHTVGNLFRHNEQTRDGATRAAVDSNSYPALGIRNNNPGNIEFNAGVQWQGQTGIGQGGRFAAFSSMEDGIRALGKQLQTYQKKYNIDTIAGIVNRWAPSSDNNNTSAYISDIVASTGFGPNQKLDLSDSAVLSALVKGIIKHENGASSTNISEAQIQEGIRRAIGSSNNPSPLASITPPRVDTNINILRQTAGATSAADYKAPVSTIVQQFATTNYNNQNNTVTQTRPRAASQWETITGPRS